MMARGGRRLVERIILFVITALLLCIGVGVSINAQRVESVTVTLLPDRVETRDLALPWSQKAFPDYRLLVIVDNRLVDLGTFQDTSVGEGLTWDIQETVPEHHLSDVWLKESRKGFDKVLEQVSVQGTRFAGENYQFEYTTAFSLMAGISHIWDMPFFKIILCLVAGILFPFLLILMVMGNHPNNPDKENILVSGAGEVVGEVAGQTIGAGLEVVGGVAEAGAEVASGLAEGLASGVGDAAGGCADGCAIDCSIMIIGLIGGPLLLAFWVLG